MSAGILLSRYFILACFVLAGMGFLYMDRKKISKSKISDVFNRPLLTTSDEFLGKDYLNMGNWKTTAVKEVVLQAMVTYGLTSTVTKSPFTATKSSQQTKVRQTWLTALPECRSERRNIVYSMDHRTASTTLQLLMFKFAKERDLLLCRDSVDVILGIWPNAIDAATLVKPYGQPCDLIADRMKFDADVLHRVMKEGSVYITTISNPVAQFQSFFTNNNIIYFVMQLAGNKNLTLHEAMRLYFVDPRAVMRYFVTLPGSQRGFPSQLYLMRQNSQLDDLGWSKNELKNTTVKGNHDLAELSPDTLSSFDKIRRNFHLILPIDYFHESLIVLKNKLCWSDDDLMYIQKDAEDAQKADLPDDIRQKIMKYHSFDMAFYKMSNDTFWKEVGKIKDFSEQLRTFKQKLKSYQITCARGTANGTACFPAGRRERIAFLRATHNWMLSKSRQMAMKAINQRINFIKKQ